MKTQEAEIDTKHQLYKIPVELEVVANNKNDADAYVCVILDMAFKYGLGLCECARQNMESPKDVTRLFDYSFIGNLDNDDADEEV